MLALNKLMFSCIMAVLAVNLTMWTFSLNMISQILSLYHLPTLIGTLHFLKLTTITVTKMIVDVIQFTLPLTTFLLVSTVYIKTLNLSFNREIWIKATLFLTTNWTIHISSCFLPLIQTRLTDSLSLTTLTSHICISTRKMTNVTYTAIGRWVHKFAFITAITSGRGYRHIAVDQEQTCMEYDKITSHRVYHTYHF